MRCTFHPETPWLTENLQVPGLSRFPIQECCEVLTSKHLNSTLKLTVSGRVGKSHENSPIIPSGIRGLFSWFWSKYSDKEHLMPQACLSESTCLMQILLIPGNLIPLFPKPRWKMWWTEVARMVSGLSQSAPSCRSSIFLAVPIWRQLVLQESPEQTAPR